MPHMLASSAISVLPSVLLAIVSRVLASSLSFVSYATIQTLPQA